MTEKFMNRFKSFLWRAGGLAVITAGSYVLNVGDIKAIDPHNLLNLAVIAVTGLVVNEVTKWYNTGQ